jgi:hypothetical protein
LVQALLLHRPLSTSQRRLPRHEGGVSFKVPGGWVKPLLVAVTDVQGGTRAVPAALSPW